MSDAPTDRHGLEVLDLAESLALLRSKPIGRLAYVAAGQPNIVPVNHLVDGASIVMRSLTGSKLDAAIMNAPVAFELDDHDPQEGTGWSVIVRGHAVPLDDADEIARFTAELDSWAVVDPRSATWIRIVGDEITGRRLERR